jgi:hypothetical protein
MKKNVSPWTIALVVLALVIETGGGQTSPNLKGPYLGQKPPGLKPQAFAPGIVTTDGDEGCVGFARGGTVFLFQRFIDGRCHTYLRRLKDGAWTAPELIPFWETMADNGDFVISNDDKTMLYQVRTDAQPEPLSHIWRAEVTDSGWGEQAPLPAPVSRASPPIQKAAASISSAIGRGERADSISTGALFRPGHTPIPPTWPP